MALEKGAKILVKPKSQNINGARGGAGECMMTFDRATSRADSFSAAFAEDQNKNIKLASKLS